MLLLRRAEGHILCPKNQKLINPSKFEHKIITVLRYTGTVERK
jgi:hypothetical protein